MITKKIGNFKNLVYAAKYLKSTFKLDLAIDDYITNEEENIKPVVIPQKHLYPLFENAKDFNSVIDLYGINKSIINVDNVLVVIKALSIKSVTISNEEKEKIKKNMPHLLNLLDFLNENLNQFSDFILVEILCLMRKLSKNLSQKETTRLLISKIFVKLNCSIETEKLNFNLKLLVHILYEAVILSRNSSTYINLLEEGLKQEKDSIYSQQQLKYLSIHMIEILLKALDMGIKSKNNTITKKRYSDLVYKITSVLELKYDEIKIHHKSFFFSFIHSFRLHHFSSIKKSPNILTKMHQDLYSYRYLLQETDFLRIIIGYQYAPVSTVPNLLNFVISSTLATIDKKPENLSFDYVLQFLKHLHKINDNYYKISINSLNLIYNEIIKRSTSTTSHVHSNLLDIVDCIHVKYVPNELLNWIETRALQEMKEHSFMLNGYVKLCFELCKLKKNPSKILQLIIQKYGNEIQNRNNEVVLKILYTLSHEILKDFPEKEKWEKYFVEVAIKKFEEDKYKFLEVFAENYLKVKTSPFLKLQEEFKKYFLSRDPRLSNYFAAHITLLYAGFSKDWITFLLNTIQHPVTDHVLLRYMLRFSYLNDANSNHFRFIIQLFLLYFTQHPKSNFLQAIIFLGDISHTYALDPNGYVLPELVEFLKLEITFSNLPLYQHILFYRFTHNLNLTHLPLAQSTIQSIFQELMKHMKNKEPDKHILFNLIDNIHIMRNEIKPGSDIIMAVESFLVTNLADKEWQNIQESFSYWVRLTEVIQFVRSINQESSKVFAEIENELLLKLNKIIQNTVVYLRPSLVFSAIICIIKNPTFIKNAPNINNSIQTIIQNLVQELELHQYIAIIEKLHSFIGESHHKPQLFLQNIYQLFIITKILCMSYNFCQKKKSLYSRHLVYCLQEEYSKKTGVLPSIPGIINLLQLIHNFQCNSSDKAKGKCVHDLNLLIKYSRASELILILKELKFLQPVINMKLLTEKINQKYQYFSEKDKIVAHNFLHSNQKNLSPLSFFCFCILITITIFCYLSPQKIKCVGLLFVLCFHLIQ